MSIRARILKGFVIVVIIGAMLGTISVIESQVFTERVKALDAHRAEKAKYTDIIDSHYVWRNNLTDSVLSGCEFEGSLDLDTCPLNTWLNSDECKAITDPVIKEELSKIAEPHLLTHQDAKYIEECVKEGNIVDAQNDLYTTVVPNIGVVIAGLKSIETHYDDMIHAEVGAMESIGDFFAVLSIVIIVAAVIVAMVLAFVIANKISNPLSALSNFMKKAGATGDLTLDPKDLEIIEGLSQSNDEIGHLIAGSASFVSHVTHIADELKTVANGDLTVSVEVLSETDTLGVSLRKMEDNLNDMFQGIHHSADQVSSASRQIAEGSQLLAEGSTDQASQIQELSSSIYDISNKTSHNAAMASSAVELADAIKIKAETGSSQMNEMMNAVRDINNASQDIGKVIKVIDDIAFQTNILALNAAVEAARAGQHGKGFAVVAEEVRNLAAKSAQAAKETSILIQNSIEKAELGSNIADETSESLNKIIESINESNLLVEEIAKSSKEQSHGIAKINSGIDHVSSVVQQNSATAQESAAASQQMSGQSVALEEMIAQFKLRNGQDEWQNHPEIIEVTDLEELPMLPPNSKYVA